MILVDTSVWIAHLRREEPRLAKLLAGGQVLIHPFVIGELACGNLRRRDDVLAYLDRLESALPATDSEARKLLETHRLMGQGLGWIDVHLLAACLLSHARLWTLDHHLSQAAGQLRIAA